METASLKGITFNVIGSRYIFTISFTKEFFYQPIQNFDQNEKQYWSRKQDYVCGDATITRRRERFCMERTILLKDLKFCWIQIWKIILLDHQN